MPEEVESGMKSRKGKLKMVRVSIAGEVGECWLCGHGWLWHKLFWWTCRDYDPITEVSYDEFKRLSAKHGG